MALTEAERLSQVGWRQFRIWCVQQAGFLSVLLLGDTHLFVGSNLVKAGVTVGLLILILSAGMAVTVTILWKTIPREKPPWLPDRIETMIIATLFVIEGSFVVVNGCWHVWAQLLRGSACTPPRDRLLQHIAFGMLVVSAAQLVAEGLFRDLRLFLKRRRERAGT